MVPMVPMMPSLYTAPAADTARAAGEGDRAWTAQLQSEASYRAVQQSEASYRADDEEDARQMADAIRASLASAEAEAAAEAARPLFDADTAPEEFLRSMQAEIASQTYAEAEAAFAARLEAEGLLTVCVPRDGDCAFRCAHLWLLLLDVASGRASDDALLHEFGEWVREGRLASRRSSARASARASLVESTSARASLFDSHAGSPRPETASAALTPAPTRTPPAPLSLHHQLRCRTVEHLSQKLDDPY